MKQSLWLACVAVMAALGCMAGGAQAVPAAEARARLTAFGGFTGNFTGDTLAKNLAITGGADLELPGFGTYNFAAEVRGMYPVADGQTVTERNLLGGIRFGRHVHGFIPYADVLFGRGELKFLNGGQADATDSFLVIQSVSNVLSFGGGVEYRVTPRIAVKGDFQFQSYKTPVTADGSLYSKVFTVGAVYRFGFGRLR